MAAAGPDDVVVRPWRVEDAPALSRAIAESLEHLRPWMPWVADEPLPDPERRAWIERSIAARGEGGEAFFGLWEDERVVGGCGLHPRIGAGGLEIGFWVHPERTRRGYATEAARRLVAMAFAQPVIDRVEIHHDPANEASGRVAAALGFTLAAEDASERIWRVTRPG